MKQHLKAVHEAVLDYAEGWYLGHRERMERALHPQFIKRRVVDHERGFETFSRDDVLESIDQGIGVEPDCEITIIVDDVSDTIATARCYSCKYIDFVHLGRFDEEWRLINVFYRHR